MRRHRECSAVGTVLLLVLTAVATAADGEPVPLRVEGFGFTVERLDEGVRAYGNRDYVWKEVPASLKGWQFTRLNGGEGARLKAVAPRETVVHVVTAPGQAGIDMAGWKRVADWGFHYTDRGRTRMAVYRRRCPAGGTLPIPQGNWTGGIVLAPAIEAAIGEREPDHSKVPGVVVDYSPAASGLYIGSPAIAILPDGVYIASHDLFGPASKERKVATSRILRSDDRGETWRPLTDIRGAFWSTLFVHRDALYLMGTDRGYGRTVIRRSTDGGRTWTEPKDPETGVLLDDGKYHCAPVPVVVHGGRIWRGMEDAMGTPPGWGAHFRAFMMSAPEDADLLKAANWTCSERLGRNPKWLDGAFGGWLEGNAVVTPDGGIVDVLRVDTKKPFEKAALVRVGPDGRAAAFDPGRDFVDFPGGAKKFTIRFDPAGVHYWTLSSPMLPFHAPAKPAGIRNTVALMRSKDLRRWETRTILLYHPDTAKHGFNYPDWLFDGEDLVAVIRTAYEDGAGGAHNYHDANYMTFHRFRGFRDLTMEDADPRYRERVKDK